MIGVLVDIEVVVVVRVPSVLLLWLNLLLNEFDEKSGKRVMIDMAEQAVKDLAILMQEKILKSCKLLFVEHLLHDFEEVAAKDS